MKIKSVSGYINLVNTENKWFLENLEICWPEIHQYLESLDGPPEGQGHKEKTPTFIANFSKDYMKVYNNILTNPFSENSQFHKLNSAYIYPDVIVKDSERVFTLGSELYLEFRRTR